MKTFRKIVWAALLVVVILIFVGLTLTKCNNTPNGKPSSAQLELNKLQNDKIASLHKQVAELSAKPASTQPANTNTLPGIFQTSRFTPVANVDSPQVRDLKTQIWKKEADMSVAKSRWIRGSNGDEACDVGLANIRAAKMTLADMKAALVRMQAAQP